MGVTVVGLNDLLRDLRALPVEAPKKFRGVVSRGGFQIKQDWKRRWSPRIGGGRQDLPHVVRGIGYDLREKGSTFTAHIGVARNNPQAPLAHFAEYGLINQAPHPGGWPALQAEAPKFIKAAGDVAVELLEGR